MSLPAAPSAIVDDRPLVISVPHPRSLALILTDAVLDLYHLLLEQDLYSFQKVNLLLDPHYIL